MALLLIQSAAGLTMLYIGGDGTVAATLVIVAAEVASIFPMSVTWLWIAVQTVAITAIWARFEGLGAIAIGGAFAGFQAFAASTIALARSERTAREDLGRTNAELLATRSLLEENSRVSERVRIARDLHDTLGHHLTALSLQLDVASRLASGQAANHVEEAHAIAKLLLSDVREVVSQMRDSSHLDLADALRALAEGAGALQIHLDMPASVDVDDAAQAQALLRCVQEIITNTARHAAARHLWIRVERRVDGIALHARDDGRGAARSRGATASRACASASRNMRGGSRSRRPPATASRCTGSCREPRRPRDPRRPRGRPDARSPRHPVAPRARGRRDDRRRSRRRRGGPGRRRREKPDVVLLDVRMPKKGGLDVLRELQADGSPPPTILLTTFDDDEVLLEGVKAGARGYLLKDVSLEQLTEAIQDRCAGRHAHPPGDHGAGAPGPRARAAGLRRAEPSRPVDQT